MCRIGAAMESARSTPQHRPRVGGTGVGSEQTEEALSAEPRAGWTPLHLACWHRRMKVIVWLTMSGADPNAKDQRGRGPSSVAPPQDSIDHGGGGGGGGYEGRWKSIHSVGAAIRTGTA